MCRSTRLLFLLVVLLFWGAAHGQTGSPGAEWKPDAEPIRYVERTPPEGSPQAAMLNLVLLRESGRSEHAGHLISKECPQWLRQGMLEPDGPMNIDTLTYQLREFEPHKALVRVDYNLTDGTFKGWTRKVILEDDQWVVR